MLWVRLGPVLQGPVGNYSEGPTRGLNLQTWLKEEAGLV